MLALIRALALLTPEWGPRQSTITGSGGHRFQFRLRLPVVILISNDSSDTEVAYVAS